VAFVLAGGRKIDYVLPVPLGPERENGFHLMLKYYKHQTGSTFRYGGHESDGEANPIRLASVIGLAKMTFDGQGCYLLDGNDKSAFNAFIANERRTLEVSRLRRSAPIAQPRREERT
jgi:hypothetical protein